MVSVGGGTVSAPSMCGEHGHCIHQIGLGYRCSCQPGYTGKYCHESKHLYSGCLFLGHVRKVNNIDVLLFFFADINDCKLNLCENGGTCVDKVNAFQCICKDGWEGALCNISKSFDFVNYLLFNLDSALVLIVILMLNT